MFIFAAAIPAGHLPEEEQEQGEGTGGGVTGARHVTTFVISCSSAHSATRPLPLACDSTAAVWSSRAHTLTERGGKKHIHSTRSEGLCHTASPVPLTSTRDI